MKIKVSSRGLTFSFRENETFTAGTRYRYIVETDGILILPDVNGKYKMSRKGALKKPLVDLRNEEVRKAIEMADYYEVEVTNDYIMVHIVKNSVQVGKLSDLEPIEALELLDREEKETFVFRKEDFVAHPDIMDALTMGGLFSEKKREDLAYIFDVGSVFSGAGMLDYPFYNDQAFELRYAVDFDRSACETYRNMIGDHILCMDMRELNPEMLPYTDVIIGGPCCQGYSNANRAASGKEEARKKRLLVQDYIRVVKEKRPLIFLIENVPQFLTKDGAEHLNTVLSELSEYEISYSVICDNDVGGATTRRRMLLFGSRIGKITVPDVELAKKLTCREALRQVDASWVHYDDVTEASKETQRKMAYVGDGENYKSIPELAHLERHSNVYRRLNPEQPGVTITNWRKVLMMPPLEFLEKKPDGTLIQRQLNCAEAKALQGLPKNFRFFGSLNDIQQQIGNGVTRALATFAKSLIKNQLFKYVNNFVL